MGSNERVLERRKPSPRTAVRTPAASIGWTERLKMMLVIDLKMEVRGIRYLRYYTVSRNARSSVEFVVFVVK